MSRIILDAESVRGRLLDKDNPPGLVGVVEEMSDEQIETLIDIVVDDRFWRQYDRTCDQVIELVRMRHGIEAA